MDSLVGTHRPRRGLRPESSFSARRCVARCANHGTRARPGGADLTAVLAELTQQVWKFSFDQKHAVASRNELVTAGYLSVVP